MIRICFFIRPPGYFTPFCEIATSAQDNTGGFAMTRQREVIAKNRETKQSNLIAIRNFVFILTQINTDIH
ncbi:MAG: hypothetical protein CO162_03020 [bacterium (Candidatus Ratteibacteria) CG_4_9_14_3_um_filter_41_21]|uniref:Uncharacterized protein n=2 Tax=Candidatus Ratteibacteria TaxID=2979319 RepID=A0A2M7YGI0_9BACT|nr:MAG: hypothetical protein AUJ76_01980 [Candidatus Omnitrophica bacterium CG1_02_41_171]PIV64473.1 MAG: hypothetical protein COS11_01990 [bacterium (Candidatus Ratteibacteria) CG01_land_8_20_14_3_00_40_19]PIW73706.1 MAG: hypothetical protein CO004_04555 [bacterium (Candidatus Ratteibacteria) CG_4_8_14_3_um_filter_41_36]PJA62068.1 MAG: hypothetical protein CO162_03020 [bacterium (Candidatus Ratteibacteria) CG_4_9_14_3_um_filter_41_21]HCG76458.1 hypothetical protein [bacterium]